MKLTHKTLVGCFIASGRANRERRCIADSRKSLNYGQTLTAAIAISRKINKPFIRDFLVRYLVRLAGACL